MKKLLYTFIFIIVFIGVSLVVIANSANTVRYAFKRFAPQYGISAAHIEGNLFSGVSIDALRYGDAKLADRIVFRWDPTALLYGTLRIVTLRLEGVDTQQVQRTIEAFLASEDTNATAASSPKEKNDTAPPLHIRCDAIHLDTLPFRVQSVAIKHASFDAKNIVYDGVVRASSLRFDLKTDAGNVRLQGALEPKRIRIAELSLLRLDVGKFLPSREHHTTEEVSSKSDTDEKTATREDRNASSFVWPETLPSAIEAETITITTAPFVYDDINVSEVALGMNGIVARMLDRTIDRGAMSLRIRTSMGILEENGTVDDNRMRLKADFLPSAAFFKRFAPQLRSEGFARIPLEAEVTPEEVKAHLRIRPGKVLRNDDANLSVDGLALHAVYRIDDHRVRVFGEGNASSAYTSHIKVRFNADKNDTIYYRAHADIAGWRGTDANVSALLGEVSVDVNGTQQSLKMHLDAAAFAGELEAEINRTGHMRLYTKKHLYPARFAALPPALQKAHADVVIEAPIRFDKPLPLEAKMQVRSNLADIDATLHYDTNVSAEATVRIPNDSLLRDLDKHVRWEAIAPLHIRAHQRGENALLKVHAPKLDAEAKLNVASGDIHGDASLKGLHLLARGNIRDDLLIVTKVDSFARLIESLKSYYAIKRPPVVKGAVTVSAVLSKNDDAFVTISSPHISYKTGRTDSLELDQLDVVLKKTGKDFELTAYRMILNDRVFFASRPSVLRLKDTQLDLSAFWINDALNIHGRLDTKRMKGVIYADADRLPYRDDTIELNASVALKAVFDGASTSVEGDVTILDGVLHYDLNARRFPSDNDIIIVQDRMGEDESGFMRHLSTNIRIHTQNPIVYKEGPVDIKAQADITLFKVPDEPFLVLGSVDLVDGGSYLFQGKRFYVEDSHIYFTGDPAEPILDIKVKYKAMRYVVTITIGGTPNIPNIIFSSVPYLTREQILSLILFDSVEGGEGNADTMMKMMGGAMAKAALNDLGVSIDHLVVGADNSVEVGKKINKRTTVIYIDGERPRVEIKYEYTPHIEIVVGADERSESVDVIYKKDFSDSDIVIVK
jgi:translocation and assembly module TamB